MGCDIHPAIEYRESADGPWKAIMHKNRYFGRYSDEPEFKVKLDLDRDYDLFAILGNVRNGRGFAGTPTGSGFDPMSDNRGIPEDISAEAIEALSHDHSPTWVTLAEILAYDWDRSSTHVGWLSPIEFAEWDRMKEWNPEPSSWCGGGNFKQLSNEEMREEIRLATFPNDAAKTEAALRSLGHVATKIQWETSYSHDSRQMWTKILPPMLNLGREHGFDNVRLVMDFDS